MRKTRILSFLIVCTVAPAFAQRTPEPDVVPTEKVILSFEKAKITRAEAIRIAAKKHKDAKVVDISFDSQGGQLAYKVKTARVKRDDDCGNDEGHRLAAALGARLSCRRRA